MANSWGESGSTWGQGDWGQQDVFTIHPSGYSITAALGDVISYNETGWGSDAFAMSMLKSSTTWTSSVTTPTLPSDLK